MNALFQRFLGGKTRTFATLTAALQFAQQFGLIHLSPEVFAALMTLFGAGVMHGLRDAIDKNA